MEHINNEELGLTEKEEKKPKKFSLSPKAKYIILSLVVIGLGFAIYSFFFRNTFSSENIIVQIDAAKQASNGEEVTWIVRLKNNSNVGIENLKLNFIYPSGTFDKEGSLKKREEAKIESLAPQKEISRSFSGIIFGKKSEKKEAKALLIYNPHGFSTEFQNEASAITLISNSFVNFDVKAPTKIDKNKEFSLAISWQSNFSFPIENVQLRVFLPEGFVSISGTEEGEIGSTFNEKESSSKQSKLIFDLGTLDEGEGGKKEIKGKLVGEVNDEKLFKVEIGRFDEVAYEFIPLDAKEFSIKIISSNIEVSRRVNGQVNYFPVSGEKLSYVVNFKNLGEDVYRDLTLTVELVGDAIDFSTLKANGGKVEGNKIIFSSENIPSLLYLGPYESGDVGFSVNLKSNYYLQNSSIKEIITINNVRKEFQTKIGSQSSFYQYAYYNLPEELKGKIVSGGKFPIEKDKETTLVINWQIKNKGNNLENVKITANLGPNVDFIGESYPAGLDISYDKNTKKITFNIGSVNYNYSKSFAFKVKIKPQNLPEDLILNSKLSGKDSWTGQTFEILSPNLNTDSVD